MSLIVLYLYKKHDNSVCVHMATALNILLKQLNTKIVDEAKQVLFEKRKWKRNTIFFSKYLNIFFQSICSLYILLWANMVQLITNTTEQLLMYLTFVIITYHPFYLNYRFILRVEILGIQIWHLGRKLK